MFLNKKEVSEKYKISQSTINRWMRNGLKFYRVSNMIRFKDEDILSYFEVVQKGRKK